MRAQLGTPVHSRDDKPLGTIEWVLVDPDTKMVRSVGVRHGILRDHAIKIALKAIHVSPSLDFLVANVDEESTRNLTHVRLHDLEAMPDGAAVAASIGGGVYPADSLMAKRPEPRVARAQSELSEMEHMVNTDVIVLGDGSDVYTVNGKHVGELEQVRFDTQTGQLLSIEVKRGVLHHREFELPGELVAGVDEGSIFLNVDLDAVKQHILEPA